MGGGPPALPVPTALVFRPEDRDVLTSASDIVNVNPISTGGGGWRGGIHPKPFFQHYSEMRKDFLLKLGNFFH